MVEETAIGIVSAATADELVGQAVNIAYGQGVSIAKICDLLLEIMGARELRLIFADERPGDVSHHYADTTKARSVLGFEPSIPVEEGLERYVQWALEQVESPDAERVRNW